VLWADVGFMLANTHEYHDTMIPLSTSASGLFLLAISLCASTATAELGFPAVRAGVWELHAERVLPNGKSQTWTRKAEYCRNPKLIFQGYWGLGSVGRAGCRFESSELTGNQYRVTSECMIRGVRAESDARITVTDDTAFELEVDVREGRQHYRAIERGQRIGDCYE
jgi:hypothetical protein